MKISNFKIQTKNFSISNNGKTPVSIFSSNKEWISSSSIFEPFLSLKRNFTEGSNSFPSDVNFSITFEDEKEKKEYVYKIIVKNSKIEKESLLRKEDKFILLEKRKNGIVIFRQGENLTSREHSNDIISLPLVCKNQFDENNIFKKISDFIIDWDFNSETIVDKKVNELLKLNNKTFEKIKVKFLIFTKKKIERSGNTLVVKDENGYVFSVKDLSSGEKKILNIFYFIYAHEGVSFIKNVEYSVYPMLLNELGESFMCKKKGQSFVAMDNKYLLNGITNLKIVQYLDVDDKKGLYTYKKAEKNKEFVEKFNDGELLGSIIFGTYM